MTSKKRDFFEAQGYRNINKRFVIAFLVLAVAIACFVIYYLSSQFSVCSDSQCFFDGLINCDKVSWIREDVSASWNYKVIGKNGEGCDVNVELLRINKGTPENEILEGKSMVCKFSGEKEFPEEDMFSCSGPLREGVQEKVIQNMYDYIFENIEEIKEKV